MRKPPEGRGFEKAISKTILSHRQWGRYLSCQKYWKYNWIWRLHCVKNFLNTAGTLFGPKGLLCPYIRYGHLASKQNMDYPLHPAVLIRILMSMAYFCCKWNKCLRPSTLVSSTLDSLHGGEVGGGKHEEHQERDPLSLHAGWWVMRSKRSLHISIMYNIKFQFNSVCGAIKYEYFAWLTLIWTEREIKCL